MVVKYSYRAHSIGFWQNFSNKTKNCRKPCFLPIIFAPKGFTLQRISQNLWQNTKNRVFTGYDWYFLGTLKSSKQFYFILDFKNQWILFSSENFKLQIIKRFYFHRNPVWWWTLWAKNEIRKSKSIIKSHKKLGWITLARIIKI